jgi:prepilin-type N-terminal cleavage/methylation domain-containing protein
MKSGFTLIEVVFAMFILSMSAFGAFALLESSLAPASLNRSSLTAYYLAQEGTELVRNIRDNNWLEDREGTVAWNEGLSVGIWEADYNSGALAAYTGRYFYIDDDPRVLSYIDSPAGEELTKYRRKITISEVSSEVIQVSVVVYWTERGTDHDVEIISQLTDWR